MCEVDTDKVCEVTECDEGRDRVVILLALVEVETGMTIAHSDGGSNGHLCPGGRVGSKQLPTHKHISGLY